MMNADAVYKLQGLTQRNDVNQMLRPFAVTGSRLSWTLMMLMILDRFVSLATTIIKTPNEEWM